MRTGMERTEFRTFLVVIGLAMTISGLSTPELSHAQEAVDKTTVTMAVAPNYPAVALSARITGEVIVEVEIDDEGVVKSAHVLEGHRLLRDDSERIARQWLFVRSSGKAPVRKARLVFGFYLLPAKASSGKPSVVFKLPYRVDVTRALTSQDEIRIRHAPARIRRK